MVTQVQDGQEFTLIQGDTLVLAGAAVVNGAPFSLEHWQLLTCELRTASEAAGGTLLGSLETYPTPEHGQEAWEARLAADLTALITEASLTDPKGVGYWEVKATKTTAGGRDGYRLYDVATVGGGTFQVRERVNTGVGTAYAVPVLAAHPYNPDDPTELTPDVLAWSPNAAGEYVVLDESGLEIPVAGVTQNSAGRAQVPILDELGAETLVLEVPIQ